MLITAAVCKQFQTVTAATLDSGLWILPLSFASSQEQLQYNFFLNQ